VAVYKRGKSWYYYFRVRGVRYRKAIPEARTKYQAQLAEARAMDDVFEGRYGKEPSRKTFGEFVEKSYLPWAKENKRSWRNDASRAKPLVAYFGRKRLSDITRFLIEQYKKARRDTLNGRGEQRSPASVNRELELLSRIFSLAIERSELESNPFKGVKKLPTDNLLTRYLTPEEEDRLMAVLTGRRSHLRAILTLDLQTGMRRSEILSLHKDQIDFRREVIELVKTKSGKRRYVPMNGVVRELLLERCQQAGPTGYLFENPKTGRPLTDIKNAWRSALSEAGIENLRFHDIRHTAGTRMADAGINPVTIQDVLGHEDIRTTMRYVHATDEAKRRAVQALEEGGRKKVSTNWPQKKKAAN
jgi:integrase